MESKRNKIARIVTKIYFGLFALVTLGIGSAIFQRCSMQNVMRRTAKPFEITHDSRDLQAASWDPAPIAPRIFSREELDKFPKVVPVGKFAHAIIADPSRGIFATPRLSGLGHITYAFPNDDGVWKFGAGAHALFPNYYSTSGKATTAVFWSKVNHVDSNILELFVSPKGIEHTAVIHFNRQKGVHLRHADLSAGFTNFLFGGDRISSQGRLTKDTQAGAFGKLYTTGSKFSNRTALRIGIANVGPAYLKTSICKAGPRIFPIDITKVGHDTNGMNNFIFEITCPKYYEKLGTRATFNGMSGSPIMQVNQETGEKLLVGAVARIRHQRFMLPDTPSWFRGVHVPGSETNYALGAADMLATQLGK